MNNVAGAMAQDPAHLIIPYLRNEKYFFPDLHNFDSTSSQTFSPINSTLVIVGLPLHLWMLPAHVGL